VDVPDQSLVRFRRVVAAACAELESRRDEVNDLNVFPVADGDTGDNMAMTMQAVLDELDRINGQLIDEIGREELVSALARAALLGARGNSGVILSQIVRGASEELASRPGELVDPVLVSAAFARAADTAYGSVRDPAEGTMLTAMRAMARRVAHDIAHMDSPRLARDASTADQDALLADALERALDAGKEAVEYGPEQLAVLREAGVVDAGAYGLTVIVAGVVAALRGHDRPELEHQAAPAPSLHLPQHESSRFRYCTNFAVTGEGLDRSALVPQLEELGDCVLVVGDERTLRVHVHTDAPESAVATFEQVGTVSRLDVADMREQVAHRTARLGGPGEAESEANLCGAVVVASGSGLVRMYEDLGALVVDGGATLNPSTYELLARIHAVEAAETLVLPNSQNVILSAERAAELSEKPARVVPTRTQQEGLPALFAFDPGRSAEQNAEAVSAAVGRLRCGGVTESARDDPHGRFAAGEAVGYVDEELIAWGDPADVLRTTLERMAPDRELLTCIVGERAPLERRVVEGLAPAGVELEYHDGGQPAWWWLLSAE
jgi:DAK2 domain fusion protein YloV